MVKRKRIGYIVCQWFAIYGFMHIVIACKINHILPFKKANHVKDHVYVWFQSFLNFGIGVKIKWKAFVVVYESRTFYISPTPDVVGNPVDTTWV